jgi:hypothetical protein
MKVQLKMVQKRSYWKETIRAHREFTEAETLWGLQAWMSPTSLHPALCLHSPHCRQISSGVCVVGSREAERACDPGVKAPSTCNKPGEEL